MICELRELTDKFVLRDYYDFKLVHELGRLPNKPIGYTWHHLDDFDPITN